MTPRSLWWATLPSPPAPRASLRGDLDVDVAVVGGGYSGLWTALHLRRADPTLRVCVLEAEHCGFGASGRNGGWASALYPLEHDDVARRSGADAAQHLHHVLRMAVAELGEAAAAEGIDCDYAHGGSLTLARTPQQAARLQTAIAVARDRGDTDADLRWLDADEAARRCAASGVLGGLFTPHCAAIHPAKLATGLAAAAERRGVAVFERTPVIRLDAAVDGHRARCCTPAGVVRADVVVRATEGFTPRLHGAHREVVPLHSLMVGTSPLPAAWWGHVGLGDRETFTDGRHLIIYGQRTSDGRLAFGGRGAPYHFGSRVATGFDHVPRVFALLEATLHELFGDLPGTITHRWGGPLAMARDRSPFVRLDRHSGVGELGGYVGDGVVMSYVAGRAMAQLIAGCGEPERLAFVEHRARPWEPEPLRWLGINAALRAAAIADERERRGGGTWSSRVFERLQRG